MKAPPPTVLRHPGLWIGAWLAVLATGFGIVVDHAFTPGVSAAAAALRPDAEDRGSSPLPELELFLHPHCPCSKATLGELARLLAHCQGRLAVTIHFLRPAEAPVGWERTELWDEAAALPGVRVLVDQGGAEAARHGARTSGQVLLYDQGGALVFSGGITAARAHEGDNLGRTAIEAFALRGERSTATTPVFGCGLVAP